MSGRWERLSSRLSDLEHKTGEPSALAPWLDALRFETSDPARANALWRTAVEARPGDSEVLECYAEFLRDVMGDTAGALPVLLRWVEAHTGNPWALYRTGDALLHLGQFEQSLAVMRQAIKIAHCADVPDVRLITILTFAMLCHDRAASDHALATIKLLIGAGIRTPGTSFEDAIWAAQDRQHPEVALLRDLAKVLSHGADVALLDSHVAWRLG